MKKVIYFSILFLLFSCLNVYADDSCTKEELKRLKELATNVSFKYDYEIIDNYIYNNVSVKDASFSITGYNLHNDLKVVYDDTLDDPWRFTSKKPTLTGFFGGVNVKINIYANTANYCSGKLLTSKTVKLPDFNTFSLREECKEYPDFKYCSEFGNFNITDEEFMSLLEEYKNEEEVKTIFGDEDSGFGDYLIYIIIAVVLILISGVVIVIIKKKRSSDL